MLDDIKRTAKAGLMMVLHLALALLAAGCLKLSEVVWTLLFPGSQPLVLGLFPFRWILETGETAIVLVFTGFGVFDAVKIMREG